jgi:homoserine dehydrogenase
MNRDIALLQLGVGRVGAAVVHIIAAQAERWRERYGLNVRYYALADSTAFLTGKQTFLTPEAVRAALLAHENGQRFAEQSGAASHDEWTHVLDGSVEAAGDAARVVVLDCASGDAMAPLLLAARAAGASVVLANKDPLTGPLAQYRALAESEYGGSLHISATVGAGLPILSALAASVASGDTIIEIGARASGSLGFFCDELSRGVAFDQALREAMARGYTEPDPRLDLSGFDVARKLLILARVAGASAELADVQVESLAPQGSEALSLAEFVAAIPDYADHLAARASNARSAGQVVRYVARMRPDGELRALLADLPPEHLLARGAGPDNVFVLRTARYDANPLVIAGPGAGIGVTAGAVVSDLLRAAGVL